MKRDECCLTNEFLVTGFETAEEENLVIQLLDHRREIELLQDVVKGSN
jgi:hypothetical protein